jgi:hypothetical protein
MVWDVDDSIVIVNSSNGDDGDDMGRLLVGTYYVFGSIVIK